MRPKKKIKLATKKQPPTILDRKTAALFDKCMKEWGVNRDSDDSTAHELRALFRDFLRRLKIEEKMYVQLRKQYKILDSVEHTLGGY